MSALYCVYSENDRDHSDDYTIEAARDVVASWLADSRKDLAVGDGWNEPSGAWGIVVERIVEHDHEPATCDECSVAKGEPHDPACDHYLPDEPERVFSPDHDYTTDFSVQESPTLAEDLAAVLRERPAVWAQLQALMAAMAVTP